MIYKKLIAFILKDGKKQDIKICYNIDKNEFKQILKNDNIKFDGIDTIIYKNLK